MMTTGTTVPLRTNSRCQACSRPSDHCLCDSIPIFDNRTEVLIVQHRRERVHPFNTARLARRSLRRATLLVDHTARLAEQLALQPGAGLLFPGSEAELLSAIPVNRRPTQLVIVDGTWHQAKTLVRDIPALRNLPRFRLAPTVPSNYRIRREPNDQALSTIEAIVAALHILEPQTEGLDQLIDTFNRMVDRQIRHPKPLKVPRFTSQRPHSVRNIPRAFVEHLAHIVVAYGESTKGKRRSTRGEQQPIYWVAERLVSGETFRCTVQTESVLDEDFLNHLQLAREHFAGALPLAAAQAQWQAFLRPTDRIAVYHRGAARLLKRLGDHRHSCLILKSIDLNSDRPRPSGEDFLTVEGLDIGPIRHPGRAGRRLAQARALVLHFRNLALSK